MVIMGCRWLLWDVAGYYGMLRSLWDVDVIMGCRWLIWDVKVIMGCRGYYGM